MARLGAGCHVPAAAYALVDDELWLRALVTSRDGDRIIRGERRGPMDQAELLGRTMAQDLLDRGAGELLRRAERYL
jgi:hydroxymethylbilane synthase